ncbi:ribonuclease H-like domain-containing protein [Desmospora profundinema]|uniref:Uncharacterized protein YprB with RNaseH-like and TPR domain n=1 Tax=Desmospora profundinema TaxID=1571184 RepID=A0ABU1IJY2_9BACL|nr:ribonuclease H-like domain-containing protein [Desmospora profundinema]MDR6224688.1 uncharacterized protein YprB with RNaseH-like and TPR domain [Desmospora profundinema]
MTSLQDRLKRHRLGSPNEREETADKTTPKPHVTKPILPSGMVEKRNEWGMYGLRRRVFSLDYAVGSYTLDRMARLRLKYIGSIAGESVGEVNVEHFLFFDTETTGLGTGAGNMIFLFGVGYFHESTFIVDQYFLPHVGHEPALLNDFLSFLRKFAILVSYNGKGFDWVQLETRRTLNRLDGGLAPVHCDLLFPSRRLWSRSLPSCRMQDVEAACLGYRRKGDLPGSLAPAHYLEYLRTGNPAAVEGVFRHNEQDILSLPCLLAHIHELLDGEAAPGNRETELSLARWWLRSGEEKRALQQYMNLLDDRSALLILRREAYREASRLHRRARRWSEAERLWQGWMKEDEWNPEPCIEWAKYCEHRSGEWRRAHVLTLEAMERFQKKKRLGRARPAEWEDLKKRESRLAAKGEGRLF